MKCANLEKLLKQNKIKKKEFSKQLGIAPSTLSGYISGLSEPDLETLFKMCDILHTDIKVIVGISEYTTTISEEDMNKIIFHQNEIQRILSKYKQPKNFGSVEKK